MPEGGVTGPSPESKAILDQMKQSQLESLATSAAVNQMTQEFQQKMNALSAAREAQTAAFNAVNRATEQIQSR
jgi:hypothetical protein